MKEQDIRVLHVLGTNSLKQRHFAATVVRAVVQNSRSILWKDYDSRSMLSWIATCSNPILLSRAQIR